jgi:hypothetical protein
MGTVLIYWPPEDANTFGRENPERFTTAAVNNTTRKTF